MSNVLSTERHSLEASANQKQWDRKPLLRRVYAGFYDLIAREADRSKPGHVVELGSGISNLKSAIPDAICTDIFPNPWIDRVENAYRLSFGNESVSHLILFDVWHHLQYPGTALREFRRVLVRGGRVIMFEPDVSLLGVIVYGLCHREPLALRQPITWLAPEHFDPAGLSYYSAQGNGARIFRSGCYASLLSGWSTRKVVRLSAISYVASGGYGGPQLYPERCFTFMRRIDRLCSRLPAVFSTRLLVVLEKTRETLQAGEGKAGE